MKHLSKMKKILLLLFISATFSITAQTIGGAFSFTISGSTIPVGMTAALTRAGQRWTNYLNITVPVKINIILINFSAAPFSGLTLGNGRQNFSNAPVSNYLYPTALANQIAGTELNPGEADMDIYINLATAMHYGTGKPNNSHEDFMTLIMHEMGHGLGFTSTGYVNSNNEGSFGNVPASALAPLTTTFPWRGQDGAPTIYDKFIIKQSHNHLIGLQPNNTVALGDSIKNNANYFDGPSFANSSNGGNPVKLSGGTGSFVLGVDLLHLNDNICNSIMSYCWGMGDTVRKPANWELGILKEIGWNTVPINVSELSNENNTHIYPNPADNQIMVSAQHIKSVSLSTIQSQVISEVKNTDFNTAPVTIDTQHLKSGIYFISIVYDNDEAIVTKKIIIQR